MAEKSKALDIWVTELNTIYPKVPFSVLTDWIQQGRILAEDKVRLSGTEKWFEVGKVQALQPYFPKPDPFRAEDRAEALESITAEGFHWKSHRYDEEDDPDMIPLIDVSLVLLIFFLMTTAASTPGVFSPIDTPPAKFQLATIGEDMYWVGVDVKSPSGKKEVDDQGWPAPWYSAGLGNETYSIRKEYNLEEADLKKFAPLAKKLKEEFKGLKGEVRVRIRADQSLPGETINQVTAGLQRLQAELNAERRPGDQLMIRISGEVSEPKSQ